MGLFQHQSGVLQGQQGRVVSPHTEHSGRLGRLAGVGRGPSGTEGRGTEVLALEPEPQTPVSPAQTEAPAGLLVSQTDPLTLTGLSFWSGQWLSDC